jgi:ectoine hydroxylase-related dioxygenase (phytanoyl-CoA dioxygenase family)
MSEELEQLHILTTKSDFPEEVKEDLHVFFSGLSNEEVVGILDLCREDTDNLVVVAQLLERRKEALIQNDPNMWQEVLSFEQDLVAQETHRKEKESVAE